MAQYIHDFLGSFLAGCDSGVEPHLLPKNKLAWLVNGTVRGGYVSPRPKYLYPELVDNSAGGGPAIITSIQSGLFQGASMYLPLPNSTLPSSTLFALISGRLFSFTPDWKPTAWDSNGYATAFTGSPGSIGVCEWTPTKSTARDDTNSSTAKIAWLDQAENYLVAQDGVTQRVLIFDGSKTFRSSPSIVEIGTISNSPNLPSIGSSVAITVSLSSGISLDDWLNGSVAMYDGSTFKGVASISKSLPGSIAVDSTPGFTAAIGDSVWVQNSSYAQSSITVNEPGYAAQYSGIISVNSPNAYNFESSSGFVSGSMYAIITVAQYAFSPFSPAGSPPYATGRTTQVQSNPITPSQVLPASYQVSLPTDPYGQYSKITALAIYATQQSSTPSYSYTPIGIVSAAQVVPASTVTGLTLDGSASYPDSSQQGAKAFVGSNTANPSANNQVQIFSGTGAATYYLTNITANSSGTVPISGWTLKSQIGIPCGRAWAYSQGRIWTSLTDRKSFVAGDIVGGSSGSIQNKFKDAILFTNTNALLAGGATFSVPSSGGEIRALRVAPTLDVSLGQGPLQILTTQSVFSCNAPTDASQWASMTSPIVTESLIGSGALSQNGTVLVNSDIIFRSQDGVRSMTMTRLDFNKWANTPISREVSRVVDYDDTMLLDFSTATVFDNRILIGASPAQYSNGVGFNKTVAINLDTVSNLQTKAPAVYDGVWDGLSNLQFVSGVVGNRCRCFSFCIRPAGISIAEILTSFDGQDFPESDATPVQIESPVLFDSNETAGSYNLIRLEDGEIYVMDIVGSVDFLVEFQPDYDDNWYPWYSWTVDNTNGLSPSKERMGLGAPPQLSDSTRNRQNRDGYSFQVRVSMSPSNGSDVGGCTFMGARFKASVVPQAEYAKPIVATQSGSPTPPVFTVMKQVFISSGTPTVQNPDSMAGLYLDQNSMEAYFWLGSQWDGGVVPTGSQVVVTGRQAFCGSGPATAATPTPDGNAGTYYDYAIKSLTFWNTGGYWGSDTTATGSGKVANTIGQDYLYGNGSPTVQVPPNGAGVYYDLDTLNLYNWNPTANFNAGGWE